MSQAQSKLARILAQFAGDSSLTLDRDELAERLGITAVEAKAAINYGVCTKCLVADPKVEGQKLARYRITQTGRDALSLPPSPPAPPPKIDMTTRSITTVVARRHVPNSVWDVARMDHLPNAGTGDVDQAAAPAAAPAAPAWKAPAAPIAPAPAPTPAAEPDKACWCALDPKGNLLISTRSACILLLRSEARELLAYIDSLRGDEMAEAILGDLGCV